MAREYLRYHGNLYYRYYGRGRMEQVFVDDPNGIILYAKERAKSRKITSLAIVVSHYSVKTNVNIYNEWHFYDYDAKTNEFKLQEKTSDKR